MCPRIIKYFSSHSEVDQLRKSPYMVCNSCCHHGSSLHPFSFFLIYSNSQTLMRLDEMIYSEIDGSDRPSLQPNDIRIAEYISSPKMFSCRYYIWTGSVSLLFHISGRILIFPLAFFSWSVQYSYGQKRVVALDFIICWYGSFFGLPCHSHLA